MKNERREPNVKRGKTPLEERKIEKGWGEEIDTIQK